jgi:hypothetical protein
LAYIGTKPTIGNFQICDAISVVNGQAAYTMQVGSVNVIPQSANHMIVSLNGTIQKPNSSFTVSGSTITFSSNLSTGDVIDFIQILGDVLDLGVPSDATVTAAKLGANSVTAAKLNNDIISGSTELASEPADTDEFLVSDAGTLKRIDYSLIKASTAVVDLFRLSATATGYQNPISSNWERADTDGAGVIGTGMTESSGVFTFPSTGIWRIEFISYYYYDGDVRGISNDLETTTDGSNFDRAATAATFIQRTQSNNTYNGAYCTFIMDVTNTSTHKVRFTGGDSGVNVAGATGDNQTHVVFTRLGDT